MRPPLFAKDQPPAAPEETDERVGNCRPPRATRFRPGQSGNPRGRPNRARIVSTLVARAFDETVEAKENGRVRRITKLEAALTQLVNHAASGDLRATQIALSLPPIDQDRPAPRKPKRIAKSDSLVVAELIRRLSRPSTSPLPPLRTPPIKSMRFTLRAEGSHTLPDDRRHDRRSMPR